MSVLCLSINRVFIMDQSRTTGNSCKGVRIQMERKIISELSAERPGRSICLLVGLVELATILTIAVGVLADASADRASSVFDISTDATATVAAEEPSSPITTDGSAETLTDVEKSMLGTWEDDYKGHRTLTLNADGTGTMVVELDGLAATLFAAKLTFSEEWTVSDGKVTMKATGGEPAGKVQLVLSLHGNSSTQRIVEVTSERMILIEEPSETRFEWRRVRGAEPGGN